MIGRQLKRNVGSINVAAFWRPPLLKLYLAAVAAVLSFPVVAQEYQATTTSNAIVRQAPGPGFQQIGLIPAGTALSVEICFSRGAFCKVTWDGPQPGFVSGELTTVGTTGQTVLAAEQAKWQALDNVKSRLDLVPQLPASAPTD